MTGKALTAPQEAFARGVASGLSQAEAYRRAYPKSLKWKQEAVHQQASELASRPYVSSRVKELQGLAAEKVVIEASELLIEARRLMRSDIRNIMTPEGRIKLPHELDADTARAVKSFEIDEDGKIKYQFWDKRATLDMLFKHKGLYEADNSQQATPVREIRLVPLKPAEGKKA